MILGYKNGVLEQYVARKKGEAVMQMTGMIDAQTMRLIDLGYHRLCGSTSEEFGRCAEDLKQGAAICELRTEGSFHPAVIMIPDALVSIREKLAVIGTDFDGSLEAFFQDDVQLVEPYAAINVRFKKTEGMPTASTSSVQAENLTLGEVIMMAMYYPAYFRGMATVVCLPGREVIVVLSYEKGNFELFSGSSESRGGWLSRWEKFQYILCDFRLKR